MVIAIYCVALAVLLLSCYVAWLIHKHDQQYRREISNLRTSVKPGADGSPLVGEDKTSDPVNVSDPFAELLVQQYLIAKLGDPTSLVETRVLETVGQLLSQRETLYRPPEVRRVVENKDAQYAGTINTTAGLLDDNRTDRPVLTRIK